MKIDKIQCLVRMNYDGNPNLTQTPRSGPSAAYAFEIPLLRAMNDSGEAGELHCCITEAEVVGQEEMTGDQIRSFLSSRYKAPLLGSIYPGGRGYPKTLADCELPHEALAKRKGNADRAAALTETAA